MAFFAGALLSAIVAIVSVKKEKLTPYAGTAAIAVGAAIFSCAGWDAWVALTMFFASASVTSRFKKRVEPDSASRARKVSQVLANGLPAALFGLVYFITGNQLFLLSPMSAIACATADTWSSDIGVLSRKKTVSILSFRAVEAGQSGGVSLLGCFTSVLGSAFIAGICVALSYFTGGKGGAPLASFITVAICGVFGSFADSLLGAGVQAKYRYGDKIIEQKEGRMQNAVLVSGFRIIDNDAVNLLSGLAAGGLSILFAYF